MIVWCRKCETEPLDTATHERLVCMPCGVGEAFDSYQLYREHNERLDAVGPYEYYEGFAPQPKPWLMAFEDKDGKIWTQEYNHVEYHGSTATYSYKYPDGLDYFYTYLPDNPFIVADWFDDHIIRSEN